MTSNQILLKLKIGYYQQNMKEKLEKLENILLKMEKKPRCGMAKGSSTTLPF
jgi:hypothetical protein